jgi:hypothetical protein
MVASMIKNTTKLKRLGSETKINGEKCIILGYKSTEKEDNPTSWSSIIGE